MSNKYTTEVIVVRNGKPSSGHRVSLEFTGGVLSGGLTNDFHTNSSGVAFVEHASTGSVKVYVDGNHSNHGTTGRAPGRITVYI